MDVFEAIDSRYVVPSAGPPVFLDPELAHLNVVTGDERDVFASAPSSFATLAESSPARSRVTA